MNIVTRRISLAANAQRTIGRNSLEANIQWVDSRIGTILVEKRDEASFRWRRDMSARYFFQEVTSYLKDGIRRIDAQYEQSVDGGYRLLQRPRLNALIGLGLVGQERQMAIPQPEGVGLLGQFFVESNWQMTTRMSFDMTGRIQSRLTPFGAFPNPQGIPAGNEYGRYFYQYNLKLNNKLRDNITLGVSREQIHDSSIANPAFRRDQRITVNLGLNF
ncbi:MAG: DUF481 domain-containing protein [Opitutaceae bacterium]|nr:DUF481 domain-containing protein [Opitutaceae bacterium]